jgi:carbamoyl-phosphate synthase large subunit
MRLGMSVEEITSRLQDRSVVPRAKIAASSRSKRGARARPAQRRPRLRRLKAPWASPTRGSAARRRRDRRGRGARARARKLGVRPVFKRIDTCAAEFASPTAYMYSTYESPFRPARPRARRAVDANKIIILGGGPNRIGQGIEFDYCCCHAAFALREAGFETIMVNCNPETVSTDYDTSDRLYFEPLTAEDVLEIIAEERKNGTLSASSCSSAARRRSSSRRRWKGGRADPRHLARRHRPRRGPRPLQALLDKLG